MSAAPLVAIPARFSASASAHRYRALSTARSLSEGVLRAGGEPLTVHPWAPGGLDGPDAVALAEEVGRRLAFADAVLLPGGGDVSPHLYDEGSVSEAVYGVDEEQDAFDLAVARWALETGVPLLAVCRGFQLVNVALGGDLEQHMAQPHTHLVHDLRVSPGSDLEALTGPAPTVSCFHHQCVRRLGAGLTVVAEAADGTVEAAVLDETPGWFLGVQWHPEDTVDSDPVQLAIFRALVTAGAAYAADTAPRRGSGSGLLSPLHQGA